MKPETQHVATQPVFLAEYQSLKVMNSAGKLYLRS